MADGLVETAARVDAPTDRRFYGVAIAQVVNNVDLTGLARVQVRFPWMPGVEPWARVATPSAGAQRGAYFIAQVGEEVLVAFNHGDLREPYVIGGLWNGQDRPPAAAPTDAITKRLVRTPAGHEIELDDLRQSVTVLSATGHRVTLGPDRVEIVDDEDETHAITITAQGVTVQAKQGHITLKAPEGTVKIEAERIELESTGQTTIEAGAACVVRGQQVRIN